MHFYRNKPKYLSLIFSNIACLIKKIIRLSLVLSNIFKVFLKLTTLNKLFSVLSNNKSCVKPNSNCAKLI